MSEAPDPEEDETGPERTCIVTRERGDPKTMLRFVVGPDGSVVPDLRGRLPGRGAWTATSAAVLAQAVKRRSFARAFRREVVVPPALPAAVEELLRREALSGLALANKAGLVLTGAFKVEDGLARDAIAVLLHASDGSADGIRKLDAAARRHALEAPSLQIFTSAQMDLALGRANVIHAALRAGGASDAFLHKAARLLRYCQAGPSPGTSDKAEPVTGLRTEPLRRRSVEIGADRGGSLPDRMTRVLGDGPQDD